MEHSTFLTTPPITPTDDDGRDESYIDDSYFLKTYVPLSSLPTPPLSSHSNPSSRQNSLNIDCLGNTDMALLGPAIHLSNLIPSSVSLIEPSISLVHSLLRCADLPIDSVALAVCILDSLNSRFALGWRRSCPLSTQDPRKPPQFHIDSVRPEVIILAALIIAVKFLDDQEYATRDYSRDWASDMWTCEQINSTQQCIMQNLGYRILPLWTKELIGDALGDMDRAGRQAGLCSRIEMAEETLAWQDEVSNKSGEKSTWPERKKLDIIDVHFTENTCFANDVEVTSPRAFTPSSRPPTALQDLITPEPIWH